jgi:formylglycine-generating enzyme required for sulfatase activity
MVESHSAQGVAYCIDAYETTNAAYKAFTQAHTATNTTQVSACTGNGSFVPDSACGGGFNDVPSASLPVVCVDWCDATAFCASAGKHLCGRVGGAHNPQADQDDANASEWFAACAGPNRAATGGELCNDSQFDPNKPGPKAASSLPDCEADIGGLFNVSGNVAEWENSCAGSGAAALCNLRGGSFQDGPFELQCSSANTLARNAASNAVGFRCCADAN